MAAELVAQNVQVIVTVALPPIRAAQRATATIPIVMITHDPIGMGFVASLAHPGGNTTGIAFQDSELSAKRLDLLRVMVPNLTGGDPVEPGRRWARRVDSGGAAAKTLAIATKVNEAHEPNDISAVVVDA